MIRLDKIFACLTLAVFVGCGSFEESDQQRLIESETKQGPEATQVADAGSPALGGNAPNTTPDSKNPELMQDFAAQMANSAEEEPDYEDGDLIGTDTSGFEKMMGEDDIPGDDAMDAYSNDYGYSMELEDPGAKEPSHDDPLTMDVDGKEGEGYLDKNKENLPKEPKPIGDGSDATKGYLDELANGGEGGEPEGDPSAGQQDQIAEMSGGKKRGKAKGRSTKSRTTTRRGGLRKRTSSRGKTAKKSSLRKASLSSSPLIILNTGVTVPTNIPSGTAVGFSINYQFHRDGPQKDLKYFWVIRSKTGKTMAKEVRLKGDGKLQTVVTEFRPDDGPFQTVIFAVSSSGQKRAISKTFTYPTF